MATLIISGDLAVAFLSSALPDTNQSGTSVWAASVRNAALDKLRAINSFPLGALPAGAVVSKATLQFSYNAQFPPGEDPVGLIVAIHRVTETWVSAQVTWNSRSTGVSWATAGGTYAAEKATFANPANDYDLVEVDVTSLADWNSAPSSLDVIMKYDDETVQRYETEYHTDWILPADPLAHGARLILVYSAPAKRSLDPGVKPAPVRGLSAARTLDLE